MNKLLRLFKIPLEKKSDFIALWRPLMITGILITIVSIGTVYLTPLFFKETPTETLGFERQELFVAFLIIISNLLVAYNTFWFVGDADEVLKEFIPNESNTLEAQKLKGKNKTFKQLNYLTFFFSGCLILLYILSAFDLLKFGLEVLFITNEIISVLIFLSFCIADYFMLRLLQIAIVSHPKSATLKSLYQFTLSAFPLIDIAGFGGVFLIAILSLFFHFYIHEHFVEGFSIGALAFHIIFTQFNFAYLKTVELSDSLI